MKIEDLKNKKIAILWFWCEGKSTLSFLEEIWIKDITILDRNEIKNWEIVSWSFMQWNIINQKIKDAEINSAWQGLNFITWESYLDNLSSFDLIIKSPWISPYIEKILPFRDKITTQTEIFFDNYTWKVIWVSWTKWKSTTATFIYEVLKNAWYKVKLVGNIWRPVLDEIDIINWENFDFIVYEMSSYMLDSFVPKLYISILLNIFREHLDWHKTEQNYIEAKLNITKNSKYSLINSKIFWSKFIENFDNLYNTKQRIKDPETSSGWQFLKFSFWETWDYSYRNERFYIKDLEVATKIESNIKANHFLENFSWVLWCIDLISKDENKDLTISFKKTLNTFTPLPHRLQVLWTFKWITFIDDAISTTPESTIEAIKSNFLDVETIFLWWTDRSYDFSWLVSFINSSNILNIVLFPETWDKIYNLLPKSFNILKTSSMEMAVKFAYKYTSIWKTTLLSTASPSYFLWKNYEEKWDEFKKYVLENS